MDTAVASLIQAIQKHLDDVQHDPGIALDERMLDEAGYFVVPQLTQHPKDQAGLVSQTSRVLPRLQQNPTPLLRLLSHLVRPYTFDDVIVMQPPVDFVAGLNPEAAPYNRLMLTLIQKAATTSAGVARLANMPIVVRALVGLWLSTPDMGIADEASNTILALLATDLERGSVSMQGVGDASSKPGRQSGSGLLWRRLLGDRDIYNLIFTSCGKAQGDAAAASSNSKQRSLAQARLLAFAPRLGEMDWSSLVRSHHPDVERAFGLDPHKEGLLDFVAVHMVDFKDDVLLHVNLMKFFSDLLVHIQEPSQQRHVPATLHYLQNHGLHDRTIAYWLDPEKASSDPLDKTFLYGPAAEYLSAYATHCPVALLQDGTLRQADGGLYSILQRLCNTLSMSASRWAHDESSRHDLNVLVSLPRVALLPQSQLGTGRQSSPLFVVPCKNTNPNALNALARIFHGPLDYDKSEAANALSGLPALQSSTDAYPPGPDSDPLTMAEAAAARALYTLYLRHHPTLFTDLVAHATTVALPEKAIAATNVIASIATARWAPLPSQNDYDPRHSPTSTTALPSESALASLLPADPSGKIAYPTTSTGIGALLQSPAREAVFPFLLRPAQSFSNLVGGRGDAESAAYKVAMAKADCLEVVAKALRRLAEHVQEYNDEAGVSMGDLRQMVDAVHERRRKGVWGAGGRTEVGEQIATMEM